MDVHLRESECVVLGILACQTAPHVTGMSLYLDQTHNAPMAQTAMEVIAGTRSAVVMMVS